VHRAKFFFAPLQYLAKQRLSFTQLPPLLVQHREIAEARDWVEYLNGHSSTRMGALRAKRLGHAERAPMTFGIAVCATQR
jgi:alpha-L-arabinofuranosidase